jgi:hypothetical protein
MFHAMKISYAHLAGEVTIAATAGTVHTTLGVRHLAARCAILTAMRVWPLLSLVCSLIGCKSEATGTQVDGAPEAGAAPSVCRSRELMPQSLKPKAYVVAGEGFGSHCIGDPISFGVRSLPLDACRETPGELTCRTGGVELSYTGNALRAIRLHWRGRNPQAAIQVNGPLFPGSTVELGGAPDQVVTALGKPTRIEKRNDAEFGSLEIWDYDGLEVEVQQHDGHSLIGGVTVHARK